MVKTNGLKNLFARQFLQTDQISLTPSILIPETTKMIMSFGLEILL
jgi:hypothetical protein